MAKGLPYRPAGPWQKHSTPPTSEKSGSMPRSCAGVSARPWALEKTLTGPYGGNCLPHARLAHSRLTAVSRAAGQVSGPWPPMLFLATAPPGQAPAVSGLFLGLLSRGLPRVPPLRSCLPGRGNIETLTALSAQYSSTVSPSPSLFTANRSKRRQEPFIQGSLASEMIPRWVLVHLTLTWWHSTR